MKVTYNKTIPVAPSLKRTNERVYFCCVHIRRWHDERLGQMARLAYVLALEVRHKCFVLLFDTCQH